MFGKRKISPSQYTKSIVLVENWTCLSKSNHNGFCLQIFYIWNEKRKRKLRLKFVLSPKTRKKEFQALFITMYFFVVDTCWSHPELTPLMRKLFIFNLNPFRFTNIFIVGINLHERKGPIASSILKLFIV